MACKDDVLDVAIQLERMSRLPNSNPDARLLAIEGPFGHSEWSNT